VWRENQLRRALGWPERGSSAADAVALPEPSTSHAVPSIVSPLRRNLILPRGMQRRPGVLP
jgi:hypothetical protein